MSAQNTPSQRPMQHNPYAKTPPMGPRQAPSTTSPPAQGTEGGSQRTSPHPPAVGDSVTGPRFAGHYHDGGTPRIVNVPSFNGYSMYVATPQHMAQASAPSAGTVAARMSPGPALGPSAAATGGTQPSHGSENRSASVPSDSGAPPSYESLVGRASPHASAAPPQPNALQSVFGTTNPWSVAAQHSAAPPSSTFTNNFFGPSTFSERGFSATNESDRARFSMNNSSEGQRRFDEDPTSMFAQGVPRLTPYTQPAYNRSENHYSQQQLPVSAPGQANNAPRPGVSAHVFLMHKLRYIPLSCDFFVPPSRHQAPGGAMGMPDRPIQMFNGRGRPMQEYCPTSDLFVAQLPFNMELTALQHLFDVVSPVQADIIHAAPHYKRGRSYDGCAFVKVSQSVAAILVETFHKAALFDEEGVWVADTPDQRNILASYCAFMQQKTPQERRALLRKPIPFSAMTVEFANRSYAF